MFAMKTMVSVSDTTVCFLDFLNTRTLVHPRFSHIAICHFSFHSFPLSVLHGGPSGIMGHSDVFDLNLCLAAPSSFCPLNTWIVWLVCSRCLGPTQSFSQQFFLNCWWCKSTTLFLCAHICPLYCSARFPIRVKGWGMQGVVCCTNWTLNVICDTWAFLCLCFVTPHAFYFCQLRADIYCIICFCHIFHF